MLTNFFLFTGAPTVPQPSGLLWPYEAGPAPYQIYSLHGRQPYSFVCFWMKSILFFVLINIHRDNTILGSMVVPTQWGANTELEMSMDSNRILKVKATPPPPNPVQFLKISNLGVCIVWCVCWTIKSYTLMTG